MASLSSSDVARKSNSPSKRLKPDVVVPKQIFLAVKKLRYFTESKIDIPLTDVLQFNQALSMVEDLIDNNKLCRYFSYMTDSNLRENNFFDPLKAIEHVDQTRHSLMNLCLHMPFTTGDLPDDYSRFRGIQGMSSKHDVIVFNSYMINGLRKNQQYFDSQICTEIFFIFVRLLHELSHACIFDSGRRMNQYNSRRFHTPMTHCLHGEAGWAVERMLFGSKIDAPDYTVDHKFIIQYLAFTDGTPSGVIDQDWIDSFVKDSLNENKLKMVESIECVPYQYLTETLQVKLEGGRKVLAKASRHSKILSFDEFDNETTSDS